MQKARFAQALGYYEELGLLEPQEPRWPHRRGDLLKRLGRVDEALCAYETAVNLYAQQGFIARAAAMAKVILDIAPERIEILERIDRDAARKLYRSTRRTVVSAAEVPAHDDDAETTQRRVLDKAVPLVAAEPARQDEVRFTRPPRGGRLTLELELSDVEVRQPPDDVELATSMRPSALEVAQLPATPLFAEVPREVLERLVTESRLVDLEPGARLLEAGTTADALYALIEGRVELKRPSQAERLLLMEGDLVGISCLLSRVNYETNATAVSQVRALRISKLLLDRLVEEHPRLGDLLLDILGRRLIANLVRSSPLFSFFDDETRAELANLVEVRRAEPGMKILESGKRSDGLYIPLLGELLARQPNGAALGRVKLGSSLGQGTLLRKQASTVTIEAQTEVLVLRIAADRFEALLARHPGLEERFEELARRPNRAPLSLIPGAHEKRG